MEFIKNDITLLNVCLVQIRSIDDVVEIPVLTTVYNTPSKIRFSQNSDNTKSGVLHKKNLQIFYPGLSAEDFQKFDFLIRGAYQIYIKTDTNEIYELSSDRFFMTCSTGFSFGAGWALEFKGDSPIPIKYRETQPEDGINIAGFDYTFDFYLS